MPPAFSAEEKAHISQLLLDSGLRAFTTQGLRKTSIEDLVRPAGIAKSSFYLFFDSKEALYLELLLRQLRQVKSRVVDGALLRGADARDSLRLFLRATIEELSNNPLYRRLMTHPEELRAVARKLDPHRMSALEDNPVTALDDFVERHRAEGALIDADPAVIVGVLRAVLLLPAHADELGKHYPAITDLLIDLVTAGLTPKQEELG